MTSAGTTPTLPERLEPQHRVILTILLASAFVVFLNETALGVALPDIMAQLNIEPSTGQWLNTSYMLTMAVIIPATGFLLQRFSTRRMYIFAMGMFTIGTFTAAISQDFSVLLLGRIFQASGNAVMMPLMMTTLMLLVPENLRGRINGNVALVMSSAPALGPAFSGLILSFLDWRWLFWIMLPIAGVVLILGALNITNASEPRKIPIDSLSVVLSALGFSGLVFGLSSFADASRGTALVSPWIPLGLGAIIFIWFVFRQRKLQRTDAALLDLRTFRSRSFTEAIAILGLMMLILFGSGILIPIYVQSVLGATPLMTGLIMLPGGLAMGLMGPMIGRIYDRVGPRKLVLPGSIAVSIAFWLMVTFNQNTSIWFVFACYTVMTLGLAFLFTPLFAFSLSSVPPQLYSHASATIGTIQQLAGAAGTALFITVMTVISVNLSQLGVPDLTATTQGMQAAFMTGAVASLGVVAIAAFIKKPATAEELAKELQP